MPFIARVEDLVGSTSEPPRSLLSLMELDRRGTHLFALAP